MILEKKVNKLKTLNDSYIILFKRYLEIIENELSKNDSQHWIRLKKMCEECITNDSMEMDKKARWCGFVQGVLFIKDLIDIENERNFSRPLFSKFYKNKETIDVLEDVKNQLMIN